MINNNLNSAQQQQLEEIGLKLNHVRTAKNISLDTVAANTRIAKRLLEAIESGNIAGLPEPFYIRALVAKFAREIGATEIEFIIQSSLNAEAAKTNGDRQSHRRYWLNFQLRSLHLYLLYVLLIIISVQVLTILVERPVVINQILEEKPTLESEVQQSEATAPIQQPESDPQFVSRSNNSDSVTVGINLQERCWLKVMVDGKLAFEGTLPKGTQRQWTGDREVTIRAGNAGGVVITFNNQQQKVLGAPGEVEEITYTVN